MWIRSEDATLANAGGKAFQLAEMQRVGLSVPAFFVLSTESAMILRERGEAHFYSNELEMLYQMVEEVCGDAASFSVRSSAQKEDGAETSFAGLFDTYLQVKKEELPEKIWQCLKSAEKEHVKDYLRHHQMEGEETAIAVIIQVMIPAEKAGVLFTANPNGLLNETVIVVGNGLGDGVVNGTVPVTTYYLKRDEDLSYFEREEDSPVLEATEIAQLVEQVDRLEGYLDCEFAIYQGKVYYLQSRPITTINATQPMIFSNSNLVESYPGLTLPLTETFIQFAYEQVFKGVAWRFSKSTSLLETYRPVFQELVVCINGRMYYHMNHLYSLLQFLPFPKQVLPIWHEMMGFDQQKTTFAPQLEKETSTWESLRISGRILREFFAAPKNMRRLDAEFTAVEAYFNQQFHHQMSEKELDELYQALADRVLKNWDVTLVNDLYAFVYTGLLKKVLEKWGQPSDVAEWNQWFSGIPAISSMEPVLALRELAAFVQEHQLVDALRELKEERDLKQFLEQDTSGFSEKFEGYLDQYGDRSLEELKLETQTFRSHPMRLLAQVLLFAEMPPQTKKATLRVEGNLSLTGWRKMIFQFLGKRARLGIQHRETSRLNRSRIYGMVRTMMVTRGKLAVAKGQLDREEDIFWHRMDELDQLDPQIVASRKHAYAGFKTLPAYGYLVFQGQPFNKAVRQAETVLQTESFTTVIGVPTSNGIITGEVLVVQDPSEVKDGARDKILVTRMTDPGWVFLLTQAKGVIAEKGSLLSHTAIISRELGIPAVVGIKNATEWFRTGDVVELNGNTGVLTLLERKEVVE